MAFKAPHCALTRSDYFGLAAWGGPKVHSANVMCLASLMRSAMITFPQWPSLWQQFMRAAERNRPVVALAQK
eukprot:6875487-Pyramimonas_sp.AAC.1